MDIRIHISLFHSKAAVCHETVMAGSRRIAAPSRRIKAAGQLEVVSVARARATGSRSESGGRFALALPVCVCVCVVCVCGVCHGRGSPGPFRRALTITARPGGPGPGDVTVHHLPARDLTVVLSRWT